MWYVWAQNLKAMLNNNFYFSIDILRQLMYLFSILSILKVLKIDLNNGDYKLQCKVR